MSTTGNRPAATQVRISQNLGLYLLVISRRRGVTRQDLVQRILEEYVDAHAEELAMPGPLLRPNGGRRNGTEA